MLYLLFETVTTAMPLLLFVRISSSNDPRWIPWTGTSTGVILWSLAIPFTLVCVSKITIAYVFQAINFRFLILLCPLLLVPFTRVRQPTVQRINSRHAWPQGNSRKSRQAVKEKREEGG